MVVPARQEATFLAQLVRWRLAGDAQGGATPDAPMPTVAEHRLVLLGVRLLAELTATEDGRLYLVNSTTLFGERDVRTRFRPLSGIVSALWHVVLEEHWRCAPDDPLASDVQQSAMSLADSFRSQDSEVPTDTGGAGGSMRRRRLPPKPRETVPETGLFRWALIAVERLRCVPHRCPVATAKTTRVHSRRLLLALPVCPSLPATLLRASRR